MEIGSLFIHQENKKKPLVCTGDKNEWGNMVVKIKEGYDNINGVIIFMTEPQFIEFCNSVISMKDKYYREREK